MKVKLNIWRFSCWRRFMQCISNWYPEFNYTVRNATTFYNPQIWCPSDLLCNLRVGHGNGLRNGTCLIIWHLGGKVIEVEIASGVNKGKTVLIPRITIAPSDTECLSYVDDSFWLGHALQCPLTELKDKPLTLSGYIFQTTYSLMDSCMLLLAG